MNPLLPVFDKYIDRNEDPTVPSLSNKKLVSMESPHQVNAGQSFFYDSPFVFSFYRVDKKQMTMRVLNPEESKDNYSYYDLSDNSFTSVHCHEFIELAYVVEGTLHLTIDNKISKFNEGEICLINSNIDHCEYYTDECFKIIYISVSHSLFDSIMRSDFMADSRQKWLRTIVVNRKENYQYIKFVPIGEETPMCIQTLTTLSNESCNMCVGSHEIINGCMARLLHILTTEYTLELTKADKEQYRKQLYFDVCSYIKENLATVSIKRLSEHFNYSNDFFGRLMKEFSGKSYVEYLQNERLRCAERMLTQTKMTVSDIVSSVGYNNVGYFYKIFRERHGILPTEYRKKFS